MKTHCVYHNDPDGWCSAAVVLETHPDANLIRMNYGFHFPRKSIKDGDTVYMVDYTLQPFEEMIKLNERCNLIWIDHHISSIRKEDEYAKEAWFEEGLRRDGTAGCELTWEYFHGTASKDDMPYIVRMIGRYDVWDHAFKPACDQVMLGLKCLPDMDNPANPEWQTLLHQDSYAATLREKGEVIYAYKETENIETCVRRAFPCKIHGVPTIACNSAHCNSSLFKSVWDPEVYDMMCVFGQLKNGRWTVSLYAEDENIDCSEIAVQYDGGGHKGAAGFNVGSFDELPIDMEELTNE